MKIKLDHLLAMKLPAGYVDQNVALFGRRSGKLYNHAGIEAAQRILRPLAICLMAFVQDNYR